MTVDKIIRCVCTYPATEEENWSNVDGMPQLVVSNGLNPHKQFWSAFCPSCGRGSKSASHKSAYLALKDWNRLQNSLWEMETKGAGWILE